MCGIFGVNRALSENEIANTLKLLEHRGPDSSGAEVVSTGTTSTTLLHTRLAIQDLSPLGHQPMRSQDSTWWVTFNGEIYNHLEIRSELNQTFKGTSDTETLVECIAHFGIEQTLSRINGIFAFAALNTKTNELHLVRDPYGIKPLYYSIENQQILFSSEIKPIQHHRKSAVLDQTALSRFLALRYTPSDLTLISGLHRLKPGHRLTYNLDNHRVSEHRFTLAQTKRFQGSYDDAVKEYEARLQSTIKRQLISDKPVGVLLSGGIDSAVVAATARQYDSNMINFTVGFGEQYDSCEIADAADTAKHLSMRHEYVEISPEHLLDDLPGIVNSIEEPLGTTSVLPMWHLCKLAKQDVTVILTGQGTDEPWGGYTRYKIELLLDSMPWLKSGLFKVPQALASLVTKDGLKRGLACLGRSNTAERFREAYALFTDSQIQALTNSDSLTPNTAEISDWLAWAPDDIPDADKMMRIDARLNLADDLLIYGDKISMAYALEARVPMLDLDLMDFVESLPVKYRTSLKETKKAHRAAAAQLVPRAVIERPKKGFQIPFQEWSTSIWREQIEAHILNSNSEIANHLDMNQVKSIWQQHSSGKVDLSRQVFSLLMLSLWMEQFLSPASSRA